MSDFWNLVADLEAIEAVPAETATEAQIEEAGNLIERLLTLPAPTPDALMWKVRYLLEVGPRGATAAWDASLVEQTVADCDRLLGSDAQ
ncbi:MAG: hypothetical protein O9296_04535 [Novosphingobium sp.]|jgi:hypothetical protein|nr:hypothetical protein [Novosphingobium sp.]